jgi:hypothetical protein
MSETGQKGVIRSLRRVPADVQHKASAVVPAHLFETLMDGCEAGLPVCNVRTTVHKYANPPLPYGFFRLNMIGKAAAAPPSIATKSRRRMRALSLLWDFSRRYLIRLDGYWPTKTLVSVTAGRCVTPITDNPMQTMYPSCQAEEQSSPKANREIDYDQRHLRIEHSRSGRGQRGPAGLQTRISWCREPDHRLAVFRAELRPSGFDRSRRDQLEPDRQQSAVRAPSWQVTHLRGCGM